MTFLAAASLCAAIGFLFPYLLSFGLRWHKLVALVGSGTVLFVMVNDFFNNRYLAGHMQWDMLCIACGFGLFWATFSVIIRALALRQNA